MSAPNEELTAVASVQIVDGVELPDEVARRLIGAMHEGVLLYDERGRIILANARALEITGIPFEELVSQAGADTRFQPIYEDGTMVPYEDRPTAVALSSGERATVTLGVPKSTGMIWIVINAEPLFREGEERPRGVLTVYTDITEHKLAEQALARSEELKGAIMAASLDAILTLTRDGEIVDLNAAAEHLYRTTREGAGGDHMTSFIPVRDRKVWEELLERLREDSSHLQGRRIEGTGRRSDGTEFPFEASITSLEAGQHQFFVTFVHDITDRRAAERRLADARDAALRASVVKSEFLATMSHEIRTPMNGVIGSLDLMLDSELAPELAELAQIARTAATDLLAIIDDILDLSKIEADKVERRAANFDLVALVEGVADIIAVTARQKGVALATYVDPELPHGVRGDARLLRQVLVNLVGNAIKFTDEGEVVIRAERQDGSDSQVLVRFTVRDTGTGIPADSVATLFEPFTQVDGSSTREHGGSGLGLAISSRLVRLMGGKLAVESEVGRGSTFSYALPFALPDELAQEPTAAPNPTGRPLRVLIVDDSDTSAETLERYLRAWGMVATRVSDPEAALERFAAAPAAERFEVAIVAATAPGDGAHTFAARLREQAGDAGLYVVALLGIGERLVETPGAAGSFDAVASLRRARGHPGRAEPGRSGRRRGPDARGARRPARPDRRGQPRQPAGAAAPGAAPRARRRRRRQRAGGARRARTAELRRGPDGLPDAGHGRLQRHTRDPRARGGRRRRAASDRRRHRKRDARGLRTLPRVRHGRFRGQAGDARGARERDRASRHRESRRRQQRRRQRLPYLRRPPNKARPAAQALPEQSRLGQAKR